MTSDWEDYLIPSSMVGDLMIQGKYEVVKIVGPKGQTTTEVIVRLCLRGLDQGYKLPIFMRTDMIPTVGEKQGTLVMVTHSSEGLIVEALKLNELAGLPDARGWAYCLAPRSGT